MQHERRRTSRRRRKLPSSKQLRLSLLAIGLCLIALSVVLLLGGAYLRNAGVMRIALLYAPAGLLCLALRAVLIWTKNRRKQHVREHRQQRAEISSQA
jgi:hypothetical protein